MMKTVLTDAVTAEPFPFLVYGTLRPGCGNYRGFLKGLTVQEQTVQVNGFQMYGNRAFPYLVHTDDEADVVTGTLISVHPSFYRRVLVNLDSLEGFHFVGSSLNHYDRKLATFEAKGQEVAAWVYVADRVVVGDLPRIMSGDWLQHKAETVQRSAHSFS